MAMNYLQIPADLLNSGNSTFRILFAGDAEYLAVIVTITAVNTLKRT